MSDFLICAVRSWRSTVLGFIGGVAVYVYTTGVTLPRTKEDVWHFAFAAVVFGGGLVAKDGVVSGPPQ